MSVVRNPLDTKSKELEMSGGPCSSLRIAYVIGGKIDPENEASVNAKRRPHVEYHTFLSRNDADVITFSALTDHKSAWVNLLLRRRERNLALAAHVFDLAGAYDAILVSGEDLGVPIALALLAKARRTNVFIITHGSYLASNKFRMVANLLRSARNVHFLCLADSLCKQLIEVFGIPKKQVHNTGYGVDTRFFRPRTSDDPPVVVSAGTAVRDYRTLVQASEGLEIDVKIAADSAWFPMPVDIRRDPLPSHVELRSYGNYEGLRDLYAQAAIVVVPLYPAKHACGYAVIVEAMAMGKCVVATSTDSKSDFIVDGETGFYVPAQDPDALRERLKFLLANPALTAKIGTAARTRIAEEFSLDAYCRRIETVISSVTKPRQK